MLQIHASGMHIGTKLKTQMQNCHETKAEMSNWRDKPQISETEKRTFDFHCIFATVLFFYFFSLILRLCS